MSNRQIVLRDESSWKEGEAAGACESKAIRLQMRDKERPKEGQRRWSNQVLIIASREDRCGYEARVRVVVESFPTCVFRSRANEGRWKV